MECICTKYVRIKSTEYCHIKNTTIASIDSADGYFNLVTFSP